MTSYSEDLLRKILRETKTVAMVGVSMNPVRPSYFVARYLDLKGFDIIPVNPMHAGERIFGKEVLASLSVRHLAACGHGGHFSAL